MGRGANVPLFSVNFLIPINHKKFVGVYFVLFFIFFNFKNCFTLIFMPFFCIKIVWFYDTSVIGVVVYSHAKSWS